MDHDVHRECLVIQQRVCTISGNFVFVYIKIVIVVKKKGPRPGSVPKKDAYDYSSEDGSSSDDSDASDDDDDDETDEQLSQLFEDSDAEDSEAFQVQSTVHIS